MKPNKYLFVLLFIICVTIAYTTKAFAAISTNRIAGNDRYKTAVQISRAGWPSSQNIVLATGENFPDALCAAPLAAKLNAPILLTEKSALNPDVENELSRLNAKKVFIIGGQGVISDNVENRLRSKGIECVRLFGSDRYQTSLSVAKYLTSNFQMSKEIAVATGEDFPDALSISPIAAGLGMPIMLVPRDNLQEGLESFISANRISKTYIVGGSDIISENAASKLPGVERIYGSDKYERNAQVLKKFEKNINFFTVYVATGENFPDALAGSALAQITSAPIVLSGKSPAKSVRDIINSNFFTINYMKAFGGEAVVPSSILSDLSSAGAKTLKVRFLNVGQAESILVQTPNGSNMLIDAGNNGDGDAIVAYLRNNGVNELDAVVATTPVEERIGGMDTVIYNFRIGKVYMPSVGAFSKSYRDLQTAITARKVNITNPSPKDTIDIDPAVRIEVLSPKESSYSRMGDHSIVLKMTYGTKSFMLTGDAGVTAEKEMVGEGYDLSSSVIKIGGFGKSTSTSSTFLDKVNPQYAVMSIGRGSDIPTPDSAILYNLQEKGAKLYRTDESGTIVCTTDGYSVSFNTIPGFVKSSGTNSEISASVYTSGKVQNPTIRLVVTGPAGGEITSVFHYRDMDRTHVGTINENNEGEITFMDNVVLDYVLNIDITISVNGKTYTTKAQYVP